MRGIVRIYPGNGENGYRNLLIKNEIMSGHVLESNDQLFIGYRYSSTDLDRNRLINQIKKGKIYAFDEEVFDGAYLYLIKDGDSLYLLRDFLGLMPCYIAVEENELLISPRKKDIWRYGIDRIYRLDPWNIYKIEINGYATLVPTHSLLSKMPVDDREIGFSDAVDIYRKYIFDRLARIPLLEKEGRAYVSFSGGVDSSLTAKVLVEQGLEVILVTAGLRGAKDLEYSIRAAKGLGLDLIVLDKKLSDAENDIIEVIEIVEDFNPMNVALALAQYWTFTEVRPKSIIALGQGTDELFGGYNRYLNIFRDGGAKALKKEIMKKTLFSYFVNFEREWKLANHFDVYNLYPLISPRIVYYGASLPVSINIRSLDDGLRKHIVRELASRLGIDKGIALAPKRSLQYSSGTMDALRAISKRRGMKPHEYLYEVYRKYRNI